MQESATKKEEFKGTLGKIESVYTKLSGFTLCTVVTRKRVIAHINWEDVTSEESKANAELFADAGNTIQSCGLLPSQLLKQNNEMRAFLNKINNDYEAFSDLNSHGYGEELEKLIESTNP